VIRLLRISPTRWLYWGEEDEVETEDHPLVWFWFQEDSPPFRRGRGLRFKEAPGKGWHIGIARPTGARSALEAVGGKTLEVTPKDISEWTPPLPEEATSVPEAQSNLETVQDGKADHS
jgi:hypothetical protein